MKELPGVAQVLLHVPHLTRRMAQTGGSINGHSRAATWASFLPFVKTMAQIIPDSYRFMIYIGRLKITLLRVIPTMTFIHFVTGKSSGILSDIYSGILSRISSGILSAYLLAYLLAFYLAYLLQYVLAYLLALYLAYLLAFYLAVEVQRCTLSWAGPRLRSSGAHWAGKVPGWGPAVHTELGRSQVEVQQCALSSEVGEELGEELARRKWRWKLMQTWSRRN